MAKCVIVCGRSDVRKIVPGTVFTHCCNTCGHPVALSPSGQRRLVREGEGTEFMCSVCLVIPKDAELDFTGTPDEIRDEIARSVPNLHRNRN